MRPSPGKNLSNFKQNESTFRQNYSNVKHNYVYPTLILAKVYNLIVKTSRVQQSLFSCASMTLQALIMSQKLPPKTSIFAGNSALKASCSVKNCCIQLLQGMLEEGKIETQSERVATTYLGCFEFYQTEFAVLSH